jgi:hypothetical protein
MAAKVDRADANTLNIIQATSSTIPLSSSWERSTTAASGTCLSGDRDLIFPIDWPEPFGIVVIEATSPPPKTSSVSRPTPCAGAVRPQCRSEYEIETQGSPVDRQLRNLKHGDAFAVLDSFGDIGKVADTPEGLFFARRIDPVLEAVLCRGPRRFSAPD